MEFWPAPCSKQPRLHSHSASNDELQDDAGDLVKSKSLPHWLKPGTYSVGVACSWVRDTERNECFNAQIDPHSLVLPYNLMLKPNVRYVFFCNLRSEKADTDKCDIRLVQYLRE